MDLQGGDAAFKHYVVARGRIDYGAIDADGDAYEATRVDRDDEFEPLNEFPLPYSVAEQILAAGGTDDEKQERWRANAESLLRSSDMDLREWTTVKLMYRSRPVEDEASTCRWDIKLSEQQPRRPASTDLKPDEVFKFLRSIIDVYPHGNSLRVRWRAPATMARKRIARDILSHESIGDVLRDAPLKQLIRGSTLQGGGGGNQVERFLSEHTDTFEVLLRSGIDV